jgi:hypothetical protein
MKLMTSAKPGDNRLERQYCYRIAIDALYNDMFATRSATWQSLVKTNADSQQAYDVVVQCLKLVGTDASAAVLNSFTAEYASLNTALGLPTYFQVMNIVNKLAVMWKDGDAWEDSKGE